MLKGIIIVLALLAFLFAPAEAEVAAEGDRASGETITVHLEGWRTDYTERSDTYGSTSRTASATVTLKDGDPGFLYIATGEFGKGGAMAGAGSSAVGAIGTDAETARRELLEEYPLVWWVEVTPTRGEPGTIELEVDWERLESQVQGKPVRTAGDVRRVVMKEDENHVLDFEHLPPDGDHDRPRDLVLKLAAGIKEDPDLAHELLRYRLWHRHRSQGGEEKTRKILLLGKQGEELDFRFETLRFDPESTVQGDPSLVDFLVEILGTVQGRIRKDGSIEVRLEANRWTDTVFNGDPRSGGVGGGGTKVFNIPSGESVVLELPVPGGSSSVSRKIEESTSSSMSEPVVVEDHHVQVNHAEFYRNREDAIILTVTRER